MSPQIAWLALVTAGLLDVGWAISMKYADGYTRLGWSIVSLVLLAAFVSCSGARCRCWRSASPTRCGPASARSAPDHGRLLFGER